MFLEPNAESQVHNAIAEAEQWEKTFDYCSITCRKPQSEFSAYKKRRFDD